MNIQRLRTWLENRLCNNKEEDALLTPAQQLRTEDRPIKLRKQPSRRFRLKNGDRGSLFETSSFSGLLTTFS